MTTAEKKLWFGFLRGFQLRVLRQRPIGHYIVDFYCPNRKLVIEVDGDSHAAEDASKYDEERTAVLQGYGLTVIRFSNADVLHSFEEVCEAIRAALQTVNPPSPPSQGG
jgi:very-short-patch-repair endonuclease